MKPTQEQIEAFKSEMWPDGYTDEDIARAITAALAAAPVGVKVKALEWTKHPIAEMWRCDTVVGRYQVASIVEPASWTFDGLPCVSAGDHADGEYEAKAAAQADYDARIRSALETPSPQPNLEAEDVGDPFAWLLTTPPTTGDSHD